MISNKTVKKALKNSITALALSGLMLGISAGSAEATTSPIFSDHYDQPRAQPKPTEKPKELSVKMEEDVEEKDVDNTEQKEENNEDSNVTIKDSPVTLKPIADNPHIMSSPFGVRVHPISGYSKMHYGADYKADCGEPLIATETGVVEQSQWDEGGYGWWVQIKIGDESVRYGHMVEQSPIEVGETVYKGQQIGQVGTTGGSTGCHLHFEVLDNKETRVEPSEFVKEAKLSSVLHVVDPIKKDWNHDIHGYPESNAIEEKGGKVRQEFEKGSLYYTPKNGSVLMNGEIEKSWDKNNKSLGYPVSSRKDVKNGFYQSFEKGDIYYSTATGAFAVKGGIRDKWKATKSVNGDLGYPISQQKPLESGNGVYQKFENGFIYSTPASKEQIIVKKDAIGKVWEKQGKHESKLGYPISNEYSPNNEKRQDFQKGYITWDKKNGAEIFYSQQSSTKYTNAPKAI